MGQQLRHVTLNVLGGPLDGTHEVEVRTDHRWGPPGSDAEWLFSLLSTSKGEATLRIERKMAAQPAYCNCLPQQWHRYQRESFSKDDLGFGIMRVRYLGAFASILGR